MQASSEFQADSLNAADPAAVQLVQLTDCHILADAQGRLKGMNTRASFEAVCRLVRADNPVFDLLLATGDLTQDASVEAYEYLAQRFEALQTPTFWLPGNHDDPHLMRQHLRGAWLSPAKQILIGNWQILLLDSTIPGETGGRLADSQIDFLEHALHLHSDRHALVCLHHHPLACGSAWIDALGLQQPGRLIETVKSHPGVRAVLWGHVHQQAQQCMHAIEWMSTPSTCVQFKPGSKDFALDQRAPGYRRINLRADGSIETGVRRLAADEFIIDTTQA